jgi:broad specificity phosphatase PhoE
MNAATVEVIRGWANPPLNNDGLQVAEAAGKLLSLYPVSKILSSDLHRAHETAMIISKHTGVPVRTTTQLRPWDVGHLTGKPIKDVIPELEYYEAHPDEKISGGESFHQFLSRWEQVLAATLQQVDLVGEVVVLVAHSRQMLALPQVLKHQRVNIPVKGGPDPGSVVRFSKVGKNWDTHLLDPNAGEYGGQGPLDLPEDHQVGIKVPYGGSCCANCHYFVPVRECNNTNYAKWQTGETATPVVLPQLAEEYCCDFWETEVNHE